MGPWFAWGLFIKPCLTRSTFEGASHFVLLTWIYGYDGWREEMEVKFSSMGVPHKDGAGFSIPTTQKLNPPVLKVSIEYSS